MKPSLLLVLLLPYLGHSARILGIFPFIGKSHYFLGSALMRSLAEAGHDVTMISPFSETTPVQNGTYRDILLVEAPKALQELLSMNMYEFEDLNPLIGVALSAYFMPGMCSATLAEDSVQKLIHSGEKFDAVIIEQFFSDCLKALAPHFGGAQIVFTSVGTNFWVDPLVGNPSPVAAIPDMTLNYPTPMTFPQRVMNTLLYSLNLLVHQGYLYPKYDAIVKKYLPNPPPIQDVLYNVSLVLLNSHPSLNPPVPYVPNMIDIGGYHIKLPKKLPQDLQKFLDEAKEGVIYFSMGSNLKSADMAPEKRTAILKSLAKLKQKVLWKWEEDTLPEQPSNVKVGKWFPQHGILAHPNVKLFITHGGMLSTTETVYFGVPVLAIPIYGDQKLNAKGAVKSGYGVSLTYKELDEEKFTQKLNEVLNNPKYAKNAKIKSQIFHDRQKKPIETAVYWVDYVIRHKGAPHLRVAALDLPWYKYHLLDVITVLLVVVVGSLIMGAVVLKKVYQMCCSKKKKTKTQ